MAHTRPRGDFVIYVERVHYLWQFDVRGPQGRLLIGRRPTHRWAKRAAKRAIEHGKV